MALLGVFFMALAPTMTMFEPNRWAGFRTPWAMKDEVNWKLTHRFGAWSLALGGLVCLLAPMFFADVTAVGIGIAAILVGSLAPYPYSYAIRRVQDAR